MLATDGVCLDLAQDLKTKVCLLSLAATLVLVLWNDEDKAPFTKNIGCLIEKSVVYGKIGRVGKVTHFNSGRE